MVEKTDKRIKRNLLAKLSSSILLLAVCFCSFAANAGLSLISDEETEVFLHQTVRPIFKASGTSFSPNRIFIVNDNSLNAFVADGNNMFVHSGTLIAADSQNEITGVLAHETGHIEGGHILRHKIMSQQLQTASLASMIAGSLAGLAAGRADISIAAILGSQGTAISNMLSYQVSEERSADESAVKLLKKINQSPLGMLNFMKKIQQRNKLEGIEESNYYRTHPISNERIAFLGKAAEESKAPTQGLNEKEFKRVQAKLFAFIEDPKATFIRYPLSNNSIPARYAHAVAYFKQHKMPLALAKINQLLDDEPNNPYFYELKAQILFENGEIAKSVDIYKKALELRPNSSLFKLNLATAMIENNPSSAEQKYIINLLNQILIYNPDSYAWITLARAYGLQEDAANYNYASAEYSIRTGDLALAKRQAQAALKANPKQVTRLKIEDLLIRIKDLEKKGSKPDL